MLRFNAGSAASSLATASAASSNRSGVTKHGHCSQSNDAAGELVERERIGDAAPFAFSSQALASRRVAKWSLAAAHRLRPPSRPLADASDVFFGARRGVFARLLT